LFLIARRNRGMVAAMRGLLLLALCLTIFLPVQGRADQVAGFVYPPWQAGADETAGSDAAPLAHCNGIIDLMAKRLGDRVIERRLFTSQQWGHVVRAKVAGTDDPPIITLVTCWSHTGGDARIMVKIDAPDIPAPR
jgi:hypothetical protein